MKWDANGYVWERSFAIVETYYKEHGKLIVPTNQVRDGANNRTYDRMFKKHC